MPSFLDKNYVEKLWHQEGSNAFTDSEKTKLTHFFNNVIRASARNRATNSNESNITETSNSKECFFPRISFYVTCSYR